MISPVSTSIMAPAPLRKPAFSVEVEMMLYIASESAASTDVVKERPALGRSTVRAEMTSLPTLTSIICRPFTPCSTFS